MNPLWMILASVGGVAVLGGVFALQQTLRRRRAARRRALHAAGKGPRHVEATGRRHDEVTREGVARQ